MAQRGNYGRRTVLQLSDDVKRTPSYGFGYKPAEEVPVQTPSFGGLGGLVSEYGQSDDEDSEYENSVAPSKPPAAVMPVQAFVAASEPEPPPLPPIPSEQLQNGNSKQPKSILKKKEVPKSILKQAKQEEQPKSKEELPPQPPPPPAAGKDDVDEKLKDFLAEIDALDHAPDEESSKPESEKGDIDGQPLTPPTLDGGEVTEEESESEDEPEPEPPKEPTTPWQHCLDEQTQYYYYWNVDTNQVTWEIPDGYSQYLLQKKEYEERKKKYDKERKEWEERKANRPPKKKKVKKAVEPITSYPPPPPPPPQLDDETAREERQKTPPPPEATVDAAKDSKKPVIKHDKKKEHHHKHKSKKSKGEEHGPGSVEIGPALPPKPPLPPAGDSDEKLSDIIGPQLPPVKKVVIGPQGLPGETNEAEMTAENETEEATKSNEDEKKIVEKEKVTESPEDVDDDAFIHQQLEEPVFSHYEYVNKRLDVGQRPEHAPSGHVENQNETFEMDLEDIDRELEMALQEKKVAGDEKQQQEFAKAGGKKRPYMDQESEMSVPMPKKTKTEGEDIQPVSDGQEGDDGMMYRILRQDVKDKVDSLAEASSLSNLILDKLEFLDVQRKGLSDLQVLLIELQTRVEDWKRGGLNTDYLLIKLRQADNHLQSFEENAAPPGWQCQWDRHYKKYFYFNTVTGDSQWDYPVDVDPTDEEPTSSWIQVEKEGVDKKEGTETEQSKLDPGEESKTIPKSSLLDYAQLAQAPPPPPGEPPPPGTETDPLPNPLEAEAEPALSNLIGYDESSDDSSSVSSYSSRSSRSSSSDSDTDDDDDDRKENGNYDPTDPTGGGDIDIDKEEEEEEAVLDPTLTLPVHSKPAHIVAQPVITRPPPSVSPVPAEESGTSEVVPNTVEGDPEQNDEKTEDASTAVAESNTKPEDIPADQLEATATDGAATSVQSISKEAKSTHHKEKKKKKEKSLSGGGLSMKKKGVSSMVQKWQQVQKDVEKQSKSSKSKRLPPPMEEGD